MNHDELAADLAQHLATPDRLVWCDMQIGPAHSPRPDVFTIQKSFSRPLPTAYECKISVSDFRRDITSGKWQDYHKFAGAVSFCVPQGLVKREDVPNGVGFMVRGESGWTTIKRPTRQLLQLSSDHLMKLLIDGYGREINQIELQRRGMREASANQKLCKKFGKEVAEVIRDLHHTKMMVGYYEKQGEQLRAKATEDVKKIITDQREQWEDLASVLGLEKKSGRFEIERAIAGLKRPDHSNEIAALKRALSDIGNIVKRNTGTD